MRYLYGSDGGSVVTDADGDVQVGRSGTVWTAKAGGSLVTDILTLAGTPTGGTVVTDALGRLAFQGPDGATATYWWDTGGGTRWAVLPTQPDQIAARQVELLGVPASLIGADNGIAPLNEFGNVPTAHLPSLSSFYLDKPSSGSTGEFLRRVSGGQGEWADLSENPLTAPFYVGTNFVVDDDGVVYAGGLVLPPEATTFSRSAVFTSPAAGTTVLWRAPKACVVVAVRGYRVGGSGATINAQKNSSDLLSTDASLVTADSWLSGSGLQNETFAAGDTLKLEIASVAGGVTSLTIQVDFQEAT